MLQKVVIALALMIAVPSLAPAQQRTVLEGVYNSTQAGRGEAAYQTHCSMCHEGNEPDGPLLTGTDFVDRWREDRLSSLLTHIRTEMPGNEPGKLSEPMYVDILAFLLDAVGDFGSLATLLTSMFLHGSWMHLIGNMWFMWIFGNNIEDSTGRIRFIFFYLICGLSAALGQVLISPDSTVPMVGASGAISGVMGAYLVLYPRVRVFAMVPLVFFLTSVALPAWVMLIYWMAIQLLGGLQSIGGTGGGVAFWAHVGGFLAGVILVRLFARRDYIEAHRSHRWRPRNAYRASDW